MPGLVEVGAKALSNTIANKVVGTESSVRGAIDVNFQNLPPVRSISTKTDDLLDLQVGLGSVLAP